MQSLVPGRDFRSSLNSGSHKKKFVVAFMTASDATFFLGFTDCVVLLKKFYEVGDTVFLEGRNIFSGGSSLEAIYQSSGSSFRAFFIKTTKES